MKIVNAYELTSHVVTMKEDDGDETILLRYTHDNWHVRMGDSWEMDMFDKSEMAEFEKLFVEWQKTSGQQ